MSGDSFFDFDDDRMIQIDDDTVLDMDSGDLHFISPWDDDDD